MRKIILLFIILFSCKQKKVNNIILNDELQKIISEYIKSNPSRGVLRVTSLDGDIKAESPATSYHIYFGVKDSDTIMFLKLLPHLCEFNPITEKIYKDGSGGSTEKIKADGFFLADKRPIIIFDSLNYTNGIIDKEHLIKKIPDSMKFEMHKLNSHIKSKPEIYKITKGNFEQITWDVLQE